MAKQRRVYARGEGLSIAASPLAGSDGEVHSLSGHGCLVAVPEVYHEFELAGTVRACDQAGSDRGNALKFLFVWGRQDPHAPLEGREKIARRLNEAGVDFEWHEFDAAHAFLRDEGPRYNPALAHVCTSLLLRFFAEKLSG